MYTTNLGGYSGCQVLLCENEDDTAFVRKVSSSLEYNDRLKVQVKKQKEFKSDSVRTPMVIGDGYTKDGFYYFDMEYIQGITLAEKIKTIEIGKIRQILDKIIDGWKIADDRCFADEKINTVKIFHSKINDLSIKLHERENLILENAIWMLGRHNWSRVTQSNCHGDLTLENIIIKDNQLYLIDFLDSFYDSWILDAGTLLQDALIMWSYRKEAKINNNTLVRLLTFKDILIDALEAWDERMSLEIYYVLLLKLVRIYPYTTDELTYAFLNKKISELMLLIRGKENI